MSISNHSLRVGAFCCFCLPLRVVLAPASAEERAHRFRTNFFIFRRCSIFSRQLLLFSWYLLFFRHRQLATQVQQFLTQVPILTPVSIFNGRSDLDRGCLCFRYAGTWRFDSEPLSRAHFHLESITSRWTQTAASVLDAREAEVTNQKAPVLLRRFRKAQGQSSGKWPAQRTCLFRQPWNLREHIAQSFSVRCAEPRKDAENAERI